MIRGLPPMPLPVPGRAAANAEQAPQNDFAAWLQPPPADASPADAGRDGDASMPAPIAAMPVPPPVSPPADATPSASQEPSCALPSHVLPSHAIPSLSAFAAPPGVVVAPTA